MRKFKLISIFLAVLAFSCGEKELNDSNFRIDPATNPEGAIRSLFFDNMQTGIAFYEYDRPASDTIQPGFALKLTPADTDSIKVVYDKLCILTFQKVVPATFSKTRMSNLQLSMPGLDSYWDFPAMSKSSEVNQIRFIAPYFLREGTMAVDVTASIECIKLVSGKPDTSIITTPPRKLFLKISKK